jgi:HK97 family phage major capsid protein
MKDEILKLLKEHKELVTNYVQNTDKRFDEVDKKMEDLKSQLTKILTPRKISLPGVTDEKEKFSFSKAFYAIATNDWSNAGFEKEVFDNTRERAMSTSGSGQYIVPSEYVAELIEMLRAKAVVIGMGATVIDDIQGSPLEIPKQTGGATAYWVGENANITASDLTDAQVSLTPKSCAALVQCSMRLLRLSNPSVETMIRNDLAKTIANAIDLAALRGSGTSNQPRGIANVSGINTVAIGTDGGTFTFKYANDMVAAVEEQNALDGNLGYIMHSKVKNKMKAERIAQFSGQTEGMYVILPMTDEMLSDALGYNFATSNQIPTNLTKGTSSDCSEVYFGNWADLIIGNWGGLELKASEEAGTSFAYNQVWIRAIQEVDIAVKHEKSFCLLSDARTT